MFLLFFLTYLRESETVDGGVTEEIVEMMTTLSNRKLEEIVQEMKNENDPYYM
jgi:hypothetical protein